jgi:hypothetical protein
MATGYADGGPYSLRLLSTEDIAVDIDTNRVRELLNKRDEIDAELAGIFTGILPKKTLRCGACHEEGHTARTCPTKP